MLKTDVTLPLIHCRHLDLRSPTNSTRLRAPTFVRQITTESIVAGTPDEVIAHYAPLVRAGLASASWPWCTGATSTPSACSRSGSFRSYGTCRPMPSPKPTGVGEHGQRRQVGSAVGTEGVGAEADLVDARAGGVTRPSARAGGGRCRWHGR